MRSGSGSSKFAVELGGFIVQDHGFARLGAMHLVSAVGIQHVHPRWREWSSLRKPFVSRAMHLLLAVGESCGPITGSGASYWSGIVLTMAAQCLDAQRWIGACVAPLLRACHKHHGCRDAAACAQKVLLNASELFRTGAVFQSGGNFLQGRTGSFHKTGSNGCHVRPMSPKPRFGTQKIFWSSDVSFGLVSCGVSFGLVS